MVFLGKDLEGIIRDAHVRGTQDHKTSMVRIQNQELDDDGSTEDKVGEVELKNTKKF